MASTISAGTSAGTAIAIAGDTSGALALQTNNGTTALSIDTSQNATIVGTTTLNKDTTVGTGAGSSGTVILGVKCESINGAFATVKIGRGAFSAYGEYKWDATNDAAIWTNNGTNIMRIASNGAYILGTATSENGQNSISFSNSSDTSSYGKAMLFNTQYNSTRNAVVFQYNSSGVGAIVTGTSSTSYNTSSDYRLKQDIAPMTGALDTVSALKPVTYKWKLDGSNGQGFIAHELQEVCPEAVSGVKDAVETYTDEDGNEQTRIKPQGIDTSFLVATLTAAIQELNAKVDAQALEIQALKGVA